MVTYAGIAIISSSRVAVAERTQIAKGRLGPASSPLRILLPL
jgi:hypothetical protein